MRRACRSWKDRRAGTHGSQGTLLRLGYGGQAEESCRLNETIITYWYNLSIITCKWFGRAGQVVSGANSILTGTHRCENFTHWRGKRRGDAEFGEAHEAGSGGSGAAAAGADAGTGEDAAVAGQDRLAG